jgi:hypothetical protein
VDFDSDWFTGKKGSSSDSWTKKKRKELEDAQYNEDVLKQETQKKTAEDDAKKKEDSKSPLDHVNDFLGGAAGFAKSVAETTASAYKRIGEGTAEVINEVTGGAQKERDIQSASNAEDIKLIKSYGEKIKSAKTDEEKQRYRDALGKLMKTSDEQTKSFQDRQNEIVERTDPTKAAGAIGSIGLDVLTAGAGGTALKGLRAGVMARGGIKAAEEVLKTGAKETAKRVAKNVAGGAGIGAAYGITGTAEELGDKAQNKDYLLNAAFGAGTGAAIPLAGEVLKKGIQKTVGAIKGRKAADVSVSTPTQTSEVVQVVNPKTGDKTFYRIPSDQRDTIVGSIDNNRDGSAIAGKDINSQVTHVTAKSPEQMAKLGFKDGGVYGHEAKLASGDLNATLNQAIDEQSDKYGTGKVAQIKNAIGDSVDPLRVFAKIDNDYAKANNIKRTKLNADESVEDLARRSSLAEREAAGLFEQKTSTGQSARDLVEKYKGDSEMGKEFNNYTNAKFDLEFREKNGDKKAIQQTIPTDDLKKFVDDYEVRNPDAQKDLATKKAINDMAVDYMSKAGAISEDEAKQIKGAYKNAVPLERVFPDDLARPEVTGKNIGSIAKQTVIQKLEGGSDIPLSNSFDTMLNRVYKAVGQGNRAKLAQKLLERQEQGLIKGGKVVVTAGNKEARGVMRENVQLLNKGLRVLDNKVKVSNRQMRKIQSELDKLNKQGLNIDLKEGGKTPLPDMNVGQLSKLKNEKGKTTSSRAFFKSLVEADPAHLQSIRDKIANREPKLAAKLDEVANLRAQMDSHKVLKQDFKNVTAEFKDDPTTGKQVISGLIDGQSYKMEVSPELAKAVQGLDQQKLPSVLKAFAIVKKPFEVTWTGVLNPVFSAISAVFYDTPMSVINSPQGFRTLGPKAIVESIKSIKSSSEFQRRLAAEGARPYGGSGASSFVKPDAKSLASQRNILSNIKYTSTHPEVALAKLDIWGGKLANMTRTRIARAAYDDALRMAKKAGDNVKDIAVQKRAMENAALAYRTIMPDFDTMSSLTRQINSVVPFYAASVAGTRSFGKALKRDPLGTGAKALALGIAPTVGVTAFSLMQPAGQQFYKDMEASDNTRTLDDNMIVVLPGAHKDDKTGEWTGIMKVPLAPEFRALNQTTWRSVRGAMGGDGPGASQIALSLFDTITGGVRNSENPLVATRRILSGEDPRTGEQIVKGDMANLPKAEQVYSSTSEVGKNVAGFANSASKFFGGKDVVSPIQADKLLSQVGLVGATAKNGGDPVRAVGENVNNRVSGAFGEKASDSFYNTYSPIKSKRDKVSREVTDLVKQNKLNEARRKAEEFNDSLTGKFSSFNKKFGASDAYDANWNDMMKGLFIKTGDDSFKARLER